MESEPTRAAPRDLSARWWRQVGFWGLTINTVLGFPVLVGALMWFPEGDWGVLAATYTSLLTAWCLAAGIRQWGKNRGVESSTGSNLIMPLD